MVIWVVWASLAAFMVISGRWGVLPKTRQDLDTLAKQYGGERVPSSEPGHGTFTESDIVEVSPTQNERLVAQGEWIAVLSVVAPAVTYGLLFYVSSWVYRGFRS